MFWWARILWNPVSTSSAAGCHETVNTQVGPCAQHTMKEDGSSSWEEEGAVRRKMVSCSSFWFILKIWFSHFTDNGKTEHLLNIGKVESTGSQAGQMVFWQVMMPLVPYKTVSHNESTTDLLQKCGCRMGPCYPILLSFIDCAVPSVLLLPGVTVVFTKNQSCHFSPLSYRSGSSTFVMAEKKNLQPQFSVNKTAVPGWRGCYNWSYLRLQM